MHANWLNWSYRTEKKILFLHRINQVQIRSCILLEIHRTRLSAFECIEEFIYEGCSASVEVVGHMSSRFKGDNSGL